MRALPLALALASSSSAALAGAFQPPAIEACPEVAYPTGIEAGPQRVELVLAVGADGRVREVLEVHGVPPFTDLAAQAASACTFVPAIEDGAPIDVHLPFSWMFAEPPIQLRGVVRAASGVVAGAQVRVGDREVVTDGEGRWALRGLTPGALEVRVTATGLRADPIRVILAADEVVDVEIRLVGEASVDEVVGTYAPLGRVAERRPLTPEEVRAAPGSLGDPIRALHSRPGLARTPFDAGWLLVRGGGPDDTGLFLDGVRMPLLFHLGGFTSVLHPEMTETVRFWPGLPPPRYQALSGAVDVVPRDLGDTPRAVAGVNVIYAHAFAEAPLGEDAAIAIAARRSYLDGILSLVLDPERARIAPRFWDGQAHLVVGRTHVIALGLSDALDAPSVDGDIVTVGQEGVQLQARTEAPLGRGTLLVAPWVAIHTRSLGDDAAPQRVVERFPGIRVEARGSPLAPARVSAGVEAAHSAFVLTQPPYRRRAPTASVDPYASVGIGTDVRLETGLRLDTSFTPGQRPRAGLSPRAHLRWSASERLTLVGELGRSHQPPAATLVLGVPEGAYLGLERSDGAAGGIELGEADWLVTATVYARAVRGMTGLETDGSVDAQTGGARGLETSARWAPGPVDLSVLYQLGRTELREDTFDPPAPTFLDQTHRVEVTGWLELPRAWTLAGRFRYGSGFPRRPGDPPYPSEATDLLRQTTVPLGLAADALRMAPFAAIDLKVARTWTFHNWALDGWLDLQNLTNRRVAEPLVSGFVESEPAYGFGLPILPVFGIEGRFGG